MVLCKLHLMWPFLYHYVLNNELMHLTFWLHLELALFTRRILFMSNRYRRILKTLDGRKSQTLTFSFCLLCLAYQFHEQFFYCIKIYCFIFGLVIIIQKLLNSWQRVVHTLLFTFEKTNYVCSWSNNLFSIKIN